MAGEGPLTFGATVALACTTSTNNAAINLPAGQQLVITNLGPDLAYIAVGTTGVTATTSGFPVLPGTQIAISLPINTTFVAGICPTSTAALRLSSGDGYVSGIGAASSGASGGPADNVTIVGPLDTHGHVEDTLFDSSGNALTYLAPGQAASAASTPVVMASDYFPPGYTYANISTDTTTQVKSGAGILYAVVVNTAGTVASAVAISDSTSTTTPVVATINALATGFFVLNAAVATGIRVVTTGTVAPNVTILYR